ncbi:MAG: acyl-CoA thioesterase [Solimonas sp.]
MKTPDVALLKAQVEIEIPFYDLDSVNIVWHGNYAKYFELARCALLEKFDYGYDAMRASGYIWPIIDFQVRYIKAITFKQRIVVEARLEEWEYRLKIDYTIRDAQTRARLTRGSTVQVAVEVKSRELCLVSPPVLLERLGVTP